VGRRSTEQLCREQPARAAAASSWELAVHWREQTVASGDLSADSSPATEGRSCRCCQDAEGGAETGLRLVQRSLRAVAQNRPNQNSHSNQNSVLIG